MASAVKRIVLHARYSAPRTAHCTRRIGPLPSQLPPWRRPFSSGVRLRREPDEAAETGRSLEVAEDENDDLPSLEETLDDDAREMLQALSPEDRAEMEEAAAKLREHFKNDSVPRDFLDDLQAEMERRPDYQEFREEFPDRVPGMDDEREKPGFLNYGEENEDIGEDREFQNDEISSHGHAELEQHREIREYARWAAWELPLLSKLAKPFEPPSNEQPLRFRYTTYLGEFHPAAKKVIVEFCPSDLPDLSEIHVRKLIKLCGSRYNPSSEIVRISCEAFETPAQNKRYLGDLLSILLKEVKEGEDTFEDVPFDFRYHTPKPWHEFPEHWKITPERKAELEAKRDQQLELDGQKMEEGRLIDGSKILQEALASPAYNKPVMAELPRRFSRQSQPRR